MRLLNISSRKAEMSFPWVPDSFYDEKVLPQFEKNSLSLQGMHICLAGQSFYKEHKGPKVPVAEYG